MIPPPARLAANRANAQLSTGPKTPEGKARSRANSDKHGLTGAGVALSAVDRAEVDRRAAASRDEMARAMFAPSAGAILARRYEAAAERGLHRALRDLKDAQEPETGRKVRPARPVGPLASISPADPGPIEDRPIEAPTPVDLRWEPSRSPMDGPPSDRD